MKNGYPSVSIEDIARLAGETCVYRGASQAIKAAQPEVLRKVASEAPGRLLKVLTLFRR
jgi:hypothetical protein